MRCRHHGMANEDPLIEDAHELGCTCRHCEQCGEHDGVFGGGLPRFVRYKLFMPSDIAFHSSSSLGLKTVIAIIAMTTSTPTKIAYSVVP